MEKKTDKTVGILGGMGPEATADLLLRIIRNTPAEDDQDHVRCLVDSNPKTPSRIQRLIEGRGEDPAPVLAQMARGLEAAGADFLVIACNTAHNYYRDVQKAVGIPVLNMIELTAQAVRAAFPLAQRAGLLASPAVRLTGLYDAPLAAQNVIPVYCPAQVETELLDIIKAVRREGVSEALRQRATETVLALRDAGAELAIVTCTELSALLSTAPLPLLDAAEVLAQAVVLHAKRHIQPREDIDKAGR